MSNRMESAIRWAPRVLGVGVAMFVGVFALDAFSQALPWHEALIHFIVHALPSIALLAVVWLAWRHEWVGGVVFIAVALLYAGMVGMRFDWIAIVSGPLLLTGILYMVSWIYRQGLPRRGSAVHPG